MKTRSLSKEQLRALGLAVEHGCVVIGKGFGRDHPDIMLPKIAAGTWRKLVFDGLLTPHSTGAPFTGEALRVETGRAGYPTSAGRARVTSA